MWGNPEWSNSEIQWLYDDEYEFLGFIGSGNDYSILNLGAITYQCRNTNEQGDSGIALADLASDWYELCSKYASLFENECKVSSLLRYHLSAVLRNLIDGMKFAQMKVIQLNAIVKRMIAKLKHGRTQFLVRIFAIGKGT